MFDFIAKQAVNLVNEAQKAINGEPGQLIADQVIPGEGEVIDSIEQEVGEIIDYTLDGGNPTELEPDPGFWEELPGDVLQNVDSATDIIGDFL